MLEPRCFSLKTFIDYQIYEKTSKCLDTNSHIEFVEIYFRDNRFHNKIHSLRLQPGLKTNTGDYRTDPGYRFGFVRFGKFYRFLPIQPILTDTTDGSISMYWLVWVSNGRIGKYRYQFGNFVPSSIDICSVKIRIGRSIL